MLPCNRLDLWGVRMPVVRAVPGVLKVVSVATDSFFMNCGVTVVFLLPPPFFLNKQNSC